MEAFIMDTRTMRRLFAMAVAITSLFIPTYSVAGVLAGDPAVLQDAEGIISQAVTQPSGHPHDLALVSIKAPKTVTLSAKKPGIVTKVVVSIQNRSPYSETIQDVNTLTKLVSLSVVPKATAGNCSTFIPVLDTGKLERAVPITLAPKKTLKVVFYVVFSCANDPLKGLGHEDYSYVATVDASAIDGQPDLNPATDICPRAPVTGEIDPFSDVSIPDRGCGGKLPGKILGAPVLTDIVLKGEIPTYSISGVVTRPVSGAVVPGVTVTASLYYTVSATTTTDINGEYRFSGLPSGAYLVTPDLASTIFSPTSHDITIEIHDVTGENFIAAQTSLIASGIDFLPDFFTTSDQLRASLIVSGENVIFTDSSDLPLKKISLSDLFVTPLARRIRGPESVFLHGETVFWVDGGQLYKTSLDGATTTLLASGEREGGVTADVVVDDTDAYWANSVSDPSICSPACTWVIQRVPLDGGPPVTLTTINYKTPVALRADENNIYWEETSGGFIDYGSIKMVPKTGGATVVLVDDTLNGLVSPPYTWYPSGGFAIAANEIFFAATAYRSYQIMSVSISGGAVSTLATVPISAGYSSIRNLSVENANLYWIDSDNRTLDALPVGGGSVIALSSDLDLPGFLPQASLAISADSAFWTEPGSSEGCCPQMGSGRIRTVSLSGGPANTVISGLDRPVALTVDSEKLVWAESWRVGQASSGNYAPTTLASGITTSMPRIAADQSDIYILDGDYIKKVSINGGAIEKLGSAHGGNLGDISAINLDIVTDGFNVYWTYNAGYGPVVQKISTTGGTPITLAVPEGWVSGPQSCYWRIAVDTQSVYWTSTSSSPSIGDCTIYKVPIDGGATTTLVGPVHLHDFTVDGTDIYFSDVGSVKKTSVDGGPIVTVASGVSAWVLANDVNNIYWVDQGSGGVIGQIAKAGESAGAEVAILNRPITTAPEYFMEGIGVGPERLYWTEGLLGNIFSLE